MSEPLAARNGRPKTLRSACHPGLPRGTTVVERRSGPPQLRPRRASPGASAYYGPTPGPREDHVAVVRIRFEIEQGLPLIPFTRRHPELQIRVTAIQPLPRHLHICEFEVIGREPKDYTAELLALPNVISGVRLEGVGNVTRYQFVIDVPLDYLTVVSEAGVLIRYPRLIQNGVHTVEVAARTSQIRAVLQDLRRVCRNVQVLRFGRATMRSCPSSLTPRQYALLHHALAAGYFDVPRRITLTTLARGLKRSKSAVSRALALIEKQLAETGAATPL
jgi:predicted DNA binding protein